MRLIKVIALLIVFISITGCMRYKYTPEDVPEVISEKDAAILVVNVGKADSIIVKIEDKAFMIDTGEKKSVPQIIAALNYLDIKELEAVFLTHTHSDHIGGFETLANIYNIKKLYSANFSIPKKNGENKIEELGKDNNVEHSFLKAGDEVRVFEDVLFKVLGPVEYNEEDDNDNSLVLKLFVNGKKILLTGDMQRAEENTLLNRNVDLRADVLKVGNHGNQDATTKRFAEAVNPSFSIISTDTAVDANSAHPVVKDRLRNSEIYITQDHDIGVLLNVHVNKIDVSSPERGAVKSGITIENVDRDNQTVTLVNSGDEVDISGYFIFSSKGSEVFVFPEGSVIEANSTFTVACVGYEGDFIWDIKNVWKKDDTATLYDRFGFALSNF